MGFDQCYITVIRSIGCSQYRLLGFWIRRRQPVASTVLAYAYSYYTFSTSLQQKGTDALASDVAVRTLITELASVGRT